MYVRIKRTLAQGEYSHKANKSEKRQNRRRKNAYNRDMCIRKEKPRRSVACIVVLLVQLLSLHSHEIATRTQRKRMMNASRHVLHMERRTRLGREIGTKSRANRGFWRFLKDLELGKSVTHNDEMPSVSFIDNPLAPDVFADGVAGFFLLHGNLRLTFEAARVNHTSSPGPISRVVIGRVVLPVSQARELALGILSFLDGQEHRGEGEADGK